MWKCQLRVLQLATRGHSVLALHRSWESFHWLLSRRNTLNRSTFQDYNPMAENLSVINFLSLKGATRGWSVMPAEELWGWTTCGVDSETDGSESWSLPGNQPVVDLKVHKRDRRLDRKFSRTQFTLTSSAAFLQFKTPISSWWAKEKVSFHSTWDTGNCLLLKNEKNKKQKTYTIIEEVFIVTNFTKMFFHLIRI